MDVITLEPPGANILKLLQSIRKLLGSCNLYKIIKAIKNVTQISAEVDEIERLVLKIKEKTGAEAAIVDVNDAYRVDILAATEGVDHHSLVENLLDNQIRYADTIIVIRVSQRLINKQPYMFIRIFNDGPPLEEDLIDRLFEEYQQGFKGQFGLGLAIVREIVGHHSGRIWVNNEEEGVAFYLEIPII